jgi:hypothetical protein
LATVYSSPESGLEFDFSASIATHDGRFNQVAENGTIEVSDAHCGEQNMFERILRER